jgi:hypothetical protein
METNKNEPKPIIVPNKVLIGKDGKPLFAEKLERVNVVLKKSGLPKLPPKE